MNPSVFALCHVLVTWFRSYVITSGGKQVKCQKYRIRETLPQQALNILLLTF